MLVHKRDEEASRADRDLALAAAAGDKAAVAALATRLAAIVPAVASRARLQPADAAELEQTVLRRLLVGQDGHSPKIGSYAEHGDLNGLLFVAASRVAIEIARAAGRKSAKEAPLDPAVALVETDAELRLMNAEIKSALSGSMRKAIRELSAQDRNVLRLAAQGTTLEQLAAMYGKHRATMVRQLARVRVAVKESILADMERQTKLGRSDLHEVLPLLQSRLDLSLSTLFGSTTDAL